ncbi:glycosyltransferase [Devosia sp. D6-9]|nr:glycosyltransferase [Devosia sp. D6-9]
MARVTIVAGLARSLVNFRGPLIDALLAAGHEVEAIAPPADEATLAWLKERNIAFVPVDLTRSSLSPFKDLRVFNQIRSALARSKPDVLIAYTIKPVIYGTLAAFFAGVRRRYAMITGLGYAFTGGEASIKRKLVYQVATTLYRMALSRAQVVLFQNPDDLAAFRQAGILSENARVAIVNGSGVDTAHYVPSPLPETPQFLMISRLVADKGVAEYIEASRLLHEILPDAGFHLVGPRDPNPAVLNFAMLDEAIESGAITYHGELADVRPAIAACSIYVLPSYREGTPRSVLEAMAMARPIITTDAPGCRETVEDGVNGILVPVKDVQALADAMKRLASDAPLRHLMGQASRARAVAKYRAEDVAAAVLDACDLRREDAHAQ